MKRKLWRFGRWMGAGLLLAAAACSGTGQQPREVDSLARIKARGTLIVLTRNAPTSYYIGRDGRPMGPEYERVVSFAHALGVKPVFVVRNSVAGLLRALADGRGDLIAAGLTRTPARTKDFLFGPVYQHVRQQVVCRRGGPRPSSVADLVGVKLEVVADSSYVALLKKLKTKHPKLQWSVDHGDGTETLLRQVWKGRLDCTVADSDIVAINRRYFPNLVVAFDLSKPQPLAWVLPHGAGKLAAAMRTWLDGYRAHGGLQAVMARYYGPDRVFDYVDLRTYARRIRKVYPAYRHLFIKAARANDLPPLILAAQSYQESHWNPKATSATGVRGMMMLTRNTARSLGVRDRLNPAASIRAGARYLAHLRSRINDAIPQGQRIWFALAAYNVGLAHLRDARRLARRLGRDPNSWRDISRTLPLLSEPRYYKHLRHGYARGSEPVRYIRRIRNYADILRQRTRMASATASLVSG